MKAAVRRGYGRAEVIHLQDIDPPVPGDNDVLMKVCAVSLNASDWEFLTGSPGYVRMWGINRSRVLGSDVAGTVEAVGKNVTTFRPGDEVYGDVLGTWGGLAERAAVPAKLLSAKPASLTFEQAATMPQAGLVALQGIRDAGHVRTGQKVLVNGAGGGSGTFALQLARLNGAEVTGVDSAHKLELMRSLGADHVLDYAAQDFTRTGERYDLVLDLVNRRPLRDNRRAIAPGGLYLMVGGSVPRILEVALLGPLVSLFSRKKSRMLMVQANRGLDALAELCETGKVTPVIDKNIPHDEAAAALQYLGLGQALGNVVVKIDG